MSTTSTNKEVAQQPEAKTELSAIPIIEGLHDPVIRTGLHVLFQKHDGHGVAIPTQPLYAAGNRKPVVLHSEQELVAHLEQAKSGEREVLIANIRRLVQEALLNKEPTQNGQQKPSDNPDQSLRAVGGWRRSI